MAEPFTFGIPLIARASSANWPLIEALLELTLASLRGQTDCDFRILIAGHDRPRAAAGDLRCAFIEADWPAAPVRSDNRDSGRKKHLIGQQVMARGGGLLMFVDADDWVDSRLVAAARATIGAETIGGIVGRGFATDFRTLRAAPVPHPAIFDGGFDRVCGSSVIARLRPDDPDPIRRDPFARLHEHYRWADLAEELGAPVARLPVAGNYLVNSSANHSETHGPFTDWRRGFTRAVNREGRAIDEAFARRFGLSLARIRAPSRRFFPEEQKSQLLIFQPRLSSA